MLTQDRVESEIQRLSAELEKATDVLGEQTQIAAEAEVGYKLAQAKAMLRAKGPVEIRKAEAHIACEQEYDRRRMSEALESTYQEKVRSLRAQLSALQSLGRIIKEQV